MDKLLTPEDWARAMEALGTPYGWAKFLADGEFHVAYRVYRRRPLHYFIHCYVGGEYRGEWSTKPDQHPQSRFLRPRTQKLIKKRELDALERKFGKRRAKGAARAVFGDLDKSLTSPDPIFLTPDSVKHHLERVCTSLQLLEAMTPFGVFPSPVRPIHAP